MAQSQPVNHPNALAGQLKIDATDTTQFGVYSTGAVRKHLINTRYRIGDKVYKYGKALDALKGCNGAFNTGIYNGVTGGNVTARVIGDTWVDILLDATTGGATWFGTKNNMVGGIYVQPDFANAQTRIITGHEKGSDGATIKIYLDGPITRTMVAVSITEICQNPYNQLTTTGDEYMSVMGVPTTVIASGEYGWLQTWGPCRIIPSLPVADTINWRTVVFVGNGTIKSFDDAISASASDSYQIAGFVLDATTGALDNPPFIMLQISPF